MRTKEKKSTRRLGRFWKIDTSRLAHSVRKCSLASIGYGQPLCDFSYPLVRGKPLKPLVGRVPTTRPLGKCSVGDLQKPCIKQAVNGLLFCLQKSGKKYFLPPLTACFLHDSKSAPTGKCSRGFEPPLGAVAKASGGILGEKSACIFCKYTTQKMHGRKTALGLIRRYFHAHTHNRLSIP